MSIFIEFTLCDVFVNPVAENEPMHQRVQLFNNDISPNKDL